MAVQKTAVWRVRIAGNDTNGAGFDSGIAGAGTDYSQQDAAQLSLTDIACSATTTVTSVTGGFTAQMIGNAIRITGGGATSGYYFITGHTDTNTITVDRTPGTVTGGTGKVGGGAITFKRLLDSANAAGDKVVAGNYVYIQGSGSDSPGSSDYADTTSHITPVSGTAADGFVKMIGENGRPRFRGDGLLIFVPTYFWMENLYISTSSNVNGSFGLISLSTNCVVKNIVVDTNNQATTAGIGISSATIVINCEIKSGTTTPTASAGSDGILAQNLGSAVINCYIHHLRGIGIKQSGGYGPTILNNILYANVGDQLSLGGVASGSAIIAGNTIDGGKDDGISITTNTDLEQINIFNNIISNHTESGKYGINVAGGSASVNDKLIAFNDYNNLYNNTADRNNLSAGANDTALDPQYVDTANGNFEIGTNLKAKGFPKATETVGANKSATNSFVDIGAAQREEPSGGGFFPPRPMVIQTVGY